MKYPAAVRTHAADAYFESLISPSTTCLGTLIGAGLGVARARVVRARVARLLTVLVAAGRLLAVRVAVARFAVRTFFGAAGALYRRTSVPPSEAIRRDALFACLYTLDE